VSLSCRKCKNSVKMTSTAFIVEFPLAVGAVVGVFQNNVMVGSCTVNICASLSWSGKPYSIIEKLIVTKGAQV